MGMTILILARPRSKAIQINLNYVFVFVKIIGHGLLEGGTNIFKTKMKLPTRKHSPRVDESNVMLIFKFDLYLTRTTKGIHKGKDITPSTSIKNLIDECH